MFNLSRSRVLCSYFPLQLLKYFSFIFILPQHFNLLKFLSTVSHHLPNLSWYFIHDSNKLLLDLNHIRWWIEIIYTHMPIVKMRYKIDFIWCPFALCLKMSNVSGLLFCYIPKLGCTFHWMNFKEYMIIFSKFYFSMLLIIIFFLGILYYL